MIIPIPMYFNESASIISNANERLLSLCDQTISFWLFFHLCYVWYITLFILFPLVTPLVAIGQHLWTWYRCDRRRIQDFSVYERSNSRLDRFCRYIHYEVRLMFTYASVAFALTWLMSNRSIHWMTISCWFIEASLIPYTLITIVTVYSNFQSTFFFWFWFTIIFSIYLHDERNFICVVAVCRIASIFKTQRLSIICLVSVLSQIRYSSYTSPIWSTTTHVSLRKLNVIIDLAINAVPCHFILSESNGVYHPRKQFLPIYFRH
jgi:hypothetical protein